jgi:putative membrane protein
MRGTARRRDIDRDRVRAAVQVGERRTSAEIAVSIAPFFFGDVERAAQRAFAKLGIAQTRRRNGVLVFVVPARHAVVVIPDDGASAHLDHSVWTRAASTIASGFARADGTAGLVEGIAELVEALRSVFPPEPGKPDELPNLFG